MSIISLKKARDAERKAVDVQEQLNQAVQDGDQLAETQQARVDEKGNPHATLKARLDAEKEETDQKLSSVTTQLAQTVKKGEGGTVSWAMAAQDLRENITGGNTAVVGVDSVLTENIVDGVVTPEKTTFAKMGKNKFDGTWLDGRVTGGYTGTLRYGGGGKIAIVKVKLNSTYTVSRSLDTDRFRVYASVGYPVGDEVLPYSFPFSNEETTVSRTVQTEDADHLVIMISSVEQSKEPEWMQVEEGDAATEYEPPGVIIEVGRRTIPITALRSVAGDDIFPYTEEKDKTLESVNATLSSITSSKNLFTGITESMSIFGDASNARFRASTDGISYITKLEKGGTYTVSKSESDRFRVATSIGYPVLEAPVNRYLLGPSNADNQMEHTFTLEGEEDHLVVFVTVSGNPPEYFQVEKGPQATGFEEAIILDLKPESVPANAIISDVKFSIPNIAGKVFESEEPNEIPPSSILTSDYFYGIFDNLMTEFPDYITRELLTEETTGLPIYYYNFVPPTFTDNSILYNHPKVFVQANIHGHEWASGLAVASFFEELCRGWKESEALKILRWSVHFIVVPVFNPWGVNARASGEVGGVARKNANGVDLNRNFPSEWVFNSDTQSTTYGGTEPLSEPETQAMYAFMKQNTDVIFALDTHNYGYYPGTNSYALWLGSHVPKTQKILAGVGNQMSTRIREEYDLTNDPLVRIASTSVGGGVVREWATQGVTSSLFELPYTIDGTGIEFSGRYAQKFSKEALGNLILAGVKYSPFVQQ